MEILEVSRSIYVEDMEDFLENSEKKHIKKLSELNIYSKIEDQKFFEDNFITIMKNKFIDIYNNLNETDILKKEKINQENKQVNNQVNRKNEGNKPENQNEIKDENKNKVNKKIRKKIGL